MRHLTILAAAVLATLALAGCARQAPTTRAAKAQQTPPATQLHIVTHGLLGLATVTTGTVVGVDPAVVTDARANTTTPMKIVTVAFGGDGGVIKAMLQPASAKYRPGERIEVMAYASDGYPAVEPLPALPAVPKSAHGADRTPRDNARPPGVEP